jgi:hypothetical protein
MLSEIEFADGFVYEEILKDLGWFRILHAKS